MYVIGTAGHVDHGKSTLVQALTGIDPDRLREEKERGMTIDLGFAWLQLPSGNEVSIVDVPGHERFVNNMLAGVGGIDLALLVVAGDESVMPQTREHLAILDLLKVERGLVAVTKRDLVDDDWYELVEADVEDVLEGTVLEGSSILPVSAVTGQGLPELLAAVDAMLADTPPKRDLERPRLPIDRSFTIAGFGTVVTGTLIDGSLDAGEGVELVLSRKETRIRGLQTHRAKVDRALPGTRVAANLSGVSHEDIYRGEVLARAGWLRPTGAMDVRLKIITDAPHPVRHNMFVTVHTGSSEAIARVRLLEAQSAAPGDSTWAQLKLSTPLAVIKGDSFVIRSNRTTLGGGDVVDPHARRHRRMFAPLLDRLEVMDSGSERDVILKTIELSEPSEFSSLVTRANLAPEAARLELQAMADEDMVFPVGGQAIGPGVFVYSANGWDAVSSGAETALEAYHRQYPLRKGAPKEELRSRMRMTQQIFNGTLPALMDDNVLVEEGTLVRLPGHSPHLDDAQRRTADDYVRLLQSAPYSPPTDAPIDPEVLNLLVDQGRVARVSETVVFSASAYEALLERVTAHLREHGEITVADVRDMFGTSRKYALALMDHLDKRRITRRVGDARVLR